MARFTRDLVLNKPDDFVQFIMNDFLQKNQFEMSDWKGEAVFRAGDAMVEGFKYLKWTYNGGVFHLEAWLASSEPFRKSLTKTAWNSFSQLCSSRCRRTDRRI